VQAFCDSDDTPFAPPFCPSSPPPSAAVVFVAVAAASTVTATSLARSPAYCLTPAAAACLSLLLWCCCRTLLPVLFVCYFRPTALDVLRHSKVVEAQYYVDDFIRQTPIKEDPLFRVRPRYEESPGSSLWQPGLLERSTSGGPVGGGGGGGGGGAGNYGGASGGGGGGAGSASSGRYSGYVGTPTYGVPRGATGAMALQRQQHAQHWQHRHQQQQQQQHHQHQHQHRRDHLDQSSRSVDELNLDDLGTDSEEQQQLLQDDADLSAILTAQAITPRVSSSGSSSSAFLSSAAPSTASAAITASDASFFHMSVATAASGAPPFTSATHTPRTVRPGTTSASGGGGDGGRGRGGGAESFSTPRTAPLTGGQPRVTKSRPRAAGAGAFPTTPL
jgi:hypothetical protein